MGDLGIDYLLWRCDLLKLLCWKRVAGRPARDQEDPEPRKAFVSARLDMKTVETLPDEKKRT